MHNHNPSDPAADLTRRSTLAALATGHVGLVGPVDHLDHLYAQRLPRRARASGQVGRPYDPDLHHETVHVGGAPRRDLETSFRSWLVVMIVIHCTPLMCCSVHGRCSDAVGFGGCRWFQVPGLSWFGVQWLSGWMGDGEVGGWVGFMTQLGIGVEYTTVHTLCTCFVWWFWR